MNVLADQPDSPQLDWRLYERIVAVVEAENIAFDMSATLNARIKGVITGVDRQIDLLIDARWDEDLSRRIIVDAKRYKRKVHVKDIESFEGMMKDCQAQYGILVCPNGWSDAAWRRAQDTIAIKLLTLEEAEESTDWANFEQCYGQCSRTAEAIRRGMVWWDGQFLLGVDNLWAIAFSGKCDVCRNFHVWCWGCGEIFALDEEDDHLCDCGFCWATLVEEAEISAGIEDDIARYLVVLMDNDLLSLERQSRF